MPLASNSLGYMEMDVKPGRVLILVEDDLLPLIGHEEVYADRPRQPMAS